MHGHEMLVFLPRRFGESEREHLQLVKLVHAVDAPDVLSVASRFPAEAPRETGQAQGQLCFVEGLLLVHPGQRLFRGSNERQLFAGDPVHLLFVQIGPAPCAGDDLWADQHGGNHGRKSLGQQQVHPKPDQGLLQQHAGPTSRHYGSRVFRLLEISRLAAMRCSRAAPVSFAISPEARFCSARRRSTSCTTSRRRRSISRTRSTSVGSRCFLRMPALTNSGLSRISLRSSISERELRDSGLGISHYAPPSGF